MYVLYMLYNIANMLKGTHVYTQAWNTGGVHRSVSANVSACVFVYEL